MDSQFLFDTFMTLVGIASLIMTVAFFICIFKACLKFINSSTGRKEQAITTKNMCEILKEMRQNKHMTQEYVADQIGVSRQTLYKWEKGMSEPSMSNLITLANLYDMDIEDLIHCSK